MQSDGEGKGVEFQSEPFAFKRCTSRQGQTERGVRELWCGSGDSVSGGGGESVHELKECTVRRHATWPLGRQAA